MLKKVFLSPSKWTLILLCFLTISYAAPEEDPSQGEVRLPAEAGWNAFLVVDNGTTGIWTVESFQVYGQFGSPEIVGLDDRGRCLIFESYSGKWRPKEVIHDGKWLGGLAFGDIDPRIPSNELYTGGQLGHLYQVVSHPEGVLDYRRIAYFPGKEIHTIVAGNLDPSDPGKELLVFTNPGGLFKVAPTGENGTFVTKKLMDLEGRVRDAVTLPAKAGEAPQIATVSRAGRLELLQLTSSEPRWSLVVEAEMGMGRIALREFGDGQSIVLYTTLDDGRIFRHERLAAGKWSSETIYAGPQGPRGIVAGQFHENPDLETIAIFGYSGKVQLLSRKESGWTAETIFQERDKGHWLAAAELDGRNGTREIIGSGYGARIFMLARPPGYGLPGVCVSPEPKAKKGRGAPEKGSKDCLRMAVRVSAGKVAGDHLSPYLYYGGFFPKNLIYETLVKMDSEGKIVPNLASSWRFENEGRTVVFTLREGARFHDGSPVTAQAVRLHFLRWVGLPEHAWIRSCDRIRRVDAVSEKELRIEMDRPHALLPDLCAFNPCAIQGPAALDREGEFVKPVGTGPFRFCAAFDEGRRIRYERFSAEEKSARKRPALELLLYEGSSWDDAVDALLRGEVDIIPGGWSAQIPLDRISGLKENPGFEVIECPGSSLALLSFRFDSGVTADLLVRRRIAAAVNREEMVQEVEKGFADPCTAWAPPSVRIWPKGNPPRLEDTREVKLPSPLRLLIQEGSDRDERLGKVIARQLEQAGLPVKIERKPGMEIRVGSDYQQVLEAGDYDLRIERTWGVPYDPYLSLTARFLPGTKPPSAAVNRFFGVNPRLRALVEKAMTKPMESDRFPVYRQIQDLMDSEALIVPLYVPRRVAVVRAGLGELKIDHDIHSVDLTSIIQ